MYSQKGVLSAIGNTPLVPLSKLFHEEKFIVHAKLEFLNPGGSSKDRPALYMITQGIEDGSINKDTVIIESSSGNLAISLVKICSYLGLRFICVIDAKTTLQNLNILKAYNAEIEYIDQPDTQTGEYLPARLERVKQLQKRYKNSFWTNQYENKNNYKAHYLTTMPEIINQLNQVDYLFCGMSSCGTARGCAEYIKEHGLQTKLIGVDAVGSLITNEGKSRRLLPGIGAGIRPKLYVPEHLYKTVTVDDLDSIKGCRELVRSESILAGGSSGAVIMAVKRLKEEIPHKATCVVILPDRGDRYLETIYSDEWVKQKFETENLTWLE